MPTCSHLLPVFKTRAIGRGAVCLALALGMVTLPNTGSAAYTFNVRGPQVTAFFISTDPTGCIETGVSVFATGVRRHRQPGPPTAPLIAEVFVFRITTAHKRS
jgi:hypothetical protein